MSKKQFANSSSWVDSLFFLNSNQLTGRILSSVELVWLKWAFFTYWRIYNTAGWKNTFNEAKIANKKSVLPALLVGRISGEVSYE